MDTNISSKWRHEVAQASGTNTRYLYQCLTGRRNASPALALRIERESRGALTRKDLRKDWREIWPDFEWPTIPPSEDAAGGVKEADGAEKECAPCHQQQTGEWECSSSELPPPKVESAKQP